MPTFDVGVKSDNLGFSTNAAHYNNRLFLVILGFVPPAGGQKGAAQARSSRQCFKDRLCHRGGAVAAAEFATVLKQVAMRDRLSQMPHGAGVSWCATRLTGGRRSSRKPGSSRK
jgi:hypothetical protein